MAASGTAYAVWDAPTWVAAGRMAGPHFPAILDVAHSLGCIRAMEILAAGVKPTNFARRLFGTEAVAQEQQRVIDYLCSIGYRHDESMFHGVRTMTSRLLICVGECRLEAITPALLAEMLRQYRSPSLRRTLYKIAQALHSVRILAEPVRPDNGLVRDDSGIDPTWLSLALRWQATSTLSQRTRSDIFGELRRTGRWLAELQPQVHAPSDWSRELAAEYVAAVNSWTVGAYAAPSAKVVKSGASLAPSTKDGVLAALRRFFKDCREWEWSEPRFEPQLAFATPRSVRALIPRDPRVIADEVWAKLIWAGLNFQDSDLPVAWGGRFGNSQVSVYPLAMFKAVAITWLFAGLRVDELVRLRVGCIRWQSPAGGPGAASAPEAEATCLLDVPVHKTGTSYTKPVDPLVGRSIADGRRCARTIPTSLIPRLANSYPCSSAGAADACRALTSIRRSSPPSARRRACQNVRSRPDNRSPSSAHHRQPALQRQRADEPPRAPGLARSSLTGLDSVLRQNQPDQADQGLQGRRILRTQRTRDQGPYRSRRDQFRRCD
jgi:hypothetical protein